MKLRTRVTNIIKRSLLGIRVHRIMGPIENLLQTAICLSDFIRWCDKHPTDSLGDDADARFRLYEHVVTVCGLQERAITYLEFGVYRGESIRWWVNANSSLASVFVGFDTFTGLPEGWAGMGAGGFSTDGHMPTIEDSRCAFVAGLFQDTLTGALSKLPLDRQLVVHFDADLYSSTLFALSVMAPHLKKQDVILFDEFSSAAHEFRAFRDFKSSYPFTYDVLGMARAYTKLALRVTEH